MNNAEMACRIVQAEEIRQASWNGDIGKYNKSIDQACFEAFEGDAVFRVVSLAFDWSDDLLAWAEAIKAGKGWSKVS